MTWCLEAGLKSAEEVMEILEAFDLTGSLLADTRDGDDGDTKDGDQGAAHVETFKGGAGRGARG
jgi:hypothetical protein